MAAGQGLCGTLLACIGASRNVRLPPGALQALTESLPLDPQVDRVDGWAGAEWAGAWAWLAVYHRVCAWHVQAAGRASAEPSLLRWPWYCQVSCLCACGRSNPTFPPAAALGTAATLRTLPLPVARSAGPPPCCTPSTMLLPSRQQQLRQRQRQSCGRLWRSPVSRTRTAACSPWSTRRGSRGCRWGQLARWAWMPCKACEACKAPRAHFRHACLRAGEGRMSLPLAVPAPRRSGTATASGGVRRRWARARCW